jgi:transaldolase/glucose-6-phosphate isomerase
MHPTIAAIHRLGQSLWYDNVHRGLLVSGAFQKLLDQGIVGVTSNPAIFAAAIGKSTDYDAALRQLLREQRDPKALYEHLAVEDIRRVADMLRPQFESSQGVDGYVSLEVSPHLAHDTPATIEEGLRLRNWVDRPNLMIKVPATPAGLPAITALTAQGVNVNVTLLFAVARYRQVAEAYITGLEQRKGGSRAPASVASFFVSRIDTLVDDLITKPGGLMEKADAATKQKLNTIVGQIAVANAYLAYEQYLQLVGTDRWKRLATNGARPQRLLWASTSTKNPAYPKTKYVEALIAPNTVNTIPPETVDAVMASTMTPTSFLDRWDANLAWAKTTLKSLAEAGISLNAVTDQLLQEAVKKFADPFDQLLASLKQKVQTLTAS